jgi:hypothetical protein
VAETLELATDVGVVVDLSVEDDPDAAIFIRHRLPAACEIDDAQPAVRQRGMGVTVEPGLVGTTMNELVTHADRAGRRFPIESIARNDASNATHG